MKEKTTNAIGMKEKTKNAIGMKEKTTNAIGMKEKIVKAFGVEKKAAKQTSPAFGFQYLLAAIIAISVIEALLAGFGVIPPILKYSLANLFFAFLRLAIVVYVASEYAATGVARAALHGGALFFASSLTLCVAAFAAPGFATHPILGIATFDGELQILFAIIVLENTLVGAVISALVAWLSGQKFFQNFLSSKKK